MANKISQIKLPDNSTYDVFGKNVVNITWADYQNLPDADKNSSNIAYFITDAPSDASNSGSIGTASGTIATFSDGSNLPMLSCVVNIEGEQDLHGYDSPWPAGGGKNKLPLILADIKSANTSGTWNGNTYTLNGVTFEVLTDRAENVKGIKANGTATANTYFDLVQTFNSTEYAGMIASFSGAVSGVWIRISASNRVALQELFGSDTVIVDNGDNLKLAIRVEAYGSPNTTICPMIRLATESDPTFAPYSNICPISGWSSCNVTVTDDLTDPTVTRTVTISFGQDVYGGVLNVSTGELTITHVIVDLGSLTWTAQEAQSNHRMRAQVNPIHKVIANNLILDGECEAYGMVSANSTYTGVEGLSGDNSGNYIFVYDSNYNTSESASAFKTAMDGVQLVYELATPQTIQLTPTQVRTIQGNNNVSVNCGSMKNVEYVKNTSGQIRMNDEVMAGGNSTGTAAYANFANQANTASDASTVSNHTVGVDVPANGVTYYGTSVTGASTVNKKATCAEFTTPMADCPAGTSVRVKFNYGNTAAAPTLNVNSMGAKPIYKFGTTEPGTSKYISWRDGSIVSFTYDGTNWIMNDVNQFADSFYVTDKEYDSSASCYPIFSSNKTAGTAYSALSNDGLRYVNKNGTTTDAGYGGVVLGNDIASGTAGNKYGFVRLYDRDSGNYAIFRSTYSLSDDVTHVLPATGGTLLNDGTTSFTQTLTSGTKIGSIKINDTSTDIYAPSATSTYSATGTTPVNGTAVASALGTLDGTVSGSAGASKTLTAFSQTNGKVSATFGNISITKSQVSDLGTIGTAAAKDYVTSVDTSASLPTSNAVKTFVENKGYVTTDTKNTAGSTDTSSKIYLIGATSQAANPQTYSQDTAYVGTDGCVYSGGNKVEVISNNAGYHNSVYRGKSLGTSITTAQWNAISAGTFDDMYIGDYWTLSTTLGSTTSNVQYVIAAFDYWWNCGDSYPQSSNKHHIVLVPATNLYSAKMNDSNITTGGYISSAMHTTNLTAARTGISNLFGDHLYSVRRLFTNAVNASGQATGWDWYTSSVDLMNENMVYGSSVWTTSGFEVGVDRTILPLFALNPASASIRAYWWLRSVATPANFSYVSNNGRAAYNGASYSLGVRPAFAIY